MMRSIHDVLRDSHKLLPEPVAQELAALFGREDLLSVLATRLLIFTRQGVPAGRPPPHFAGEWTPPLAEAFAFFRDAVVAWHDAPASPGIPGLLADAIRAAGLENLLVLLGQRMTPGSITDARALPPPREKLLASALRPYGPGDPLSTAARALTKHAPRAAPFWGHPDGSSADKNTHARRLVEHILDTSMWWNVFGHFQHGFIYEARVATGHGARWAQDGAMFIGFVEPFDEGQRLDEGAADG